MLRLRPGDALTVSDGAGLVAGLPLRSGARVGDGEVQHVAGARPALTVGFALVKGERPELIVQKLTELGVDRIVPFAAARSVVRWDAERARRHWPAPAAGWPGRRPCSRRRCWLPEVVVAPGFAEVVAASPPEALALADRGGEPPTAATTTVLVGPEGGWTDEERAAAPRRVGLGDHVLRVETAAIAAGVVLAALRSGRVKSARIGWWRLGLPAERPTARWCGFALGRDPGDGSGLCRSDRRRGETCST